MDDSAIARAVHVLAVLMWIGGVAFVTTVLMPSIRAAHPPADRMTAFHKIEDRFARQARMWVLLAGASGFWMVNRAELWDRFADLRFWWMHAMVGVWAAFTLMLFVAEPLFMHRRMAAPNQPPDRFARMERMHRLALVLAVVTVLGATAGSHGMF